MKKKGNEVVLYVTRHGKTHFNTVRRVQGWSDTPLTDEGVRVAEQLGKGLKKENVHFDAAYSSDSGRARETARIVLDSIGQRELTITENKKIGRRTSVFMKVI
ncbi:phosphoglycerate mutase family protein [Numidum massiliense]|uniref:phosphoglycerate mutase family protein n=1 Tax=Numidum massiliense TaxID=1522315 RepID=UPI0006D590E5|nr:phosphoglycerate mutase family protein [Numidum massiliense]